MSVKSAMMQLAQPSDTRQVHNHKCILVGDSNAIVRGPPSTPHFVTDGSLCAFGHQPHYPMHANSQVIQNTL